MTWDYPCPTVGTELESSLRLCYALAKKVTDYAISSDKAATRGMAIQHAFPPQSLIHDAICNTLDAITRHAYGLG